MQQAWECLHFAAANGEAAACFALGSMAAEGHGVPASQREAVAWFKEGSEVGTPPSTVAALMACAHCTMSGLSDPDHALCQLNWQLMVLVKLLQEMCLAYSPMHIA